MEKEIQKEENQKRAKKGPNTTSTGTTTGDGHDPDDDNDRGLNNTTVKKFEKFSMSTRKNEALKNVVVETEKKKEKADGAVLLERHDIRLRL